MHYSKNDGLLVQMRRFTMRAWQPHLSRIALRSTRANAKLGKKHWPSMNRVAPRAHNT